MSAAIPGLKLSMDAYGTGNSSLAYIKDLSLDKLKIDRAFVSGMNKDAQRAAIVDSTIDLGRAGDVINWLNRESSVSR